MRIAFGIVSLFSSGGLQRECIGVAGVLRQLGHETTIFTARKTGQFSHDLDIRILPAVSQTNHGRNLAFSRELRLATASGYDRIVGFDFLTALDALYCPHPSMAYRIKQRPYLIFPRYRTYAALEGESFKRGGRTRILLLTENQKREFQAAWQTEDDRITVLPPTVAPDRLQSEKRSDGTRQRMRQQFQLDHDRICWLAVCAHPETKGLDRTIEALRQFDDVMLVVCGLSADDRKAARYVALAKTSGVDTRVKWLGVREDIPDLLAMADIFVHPARYDTTGTVILESVINGLPVVTTDVCGYATHVLAAEAGLVLRGTFKMAEFVEALHAMMSLSKRTAYCDGGIRYGRQPWLYQSRNRAAEIIAG